jgi:hypothetical protein
MFFPLVSFASAFEWQFAGLTEDLELLNCIQI